MYKRQILTRPAVEAGEKLGFLPGDLQSKVDPYLRPLYDGLFDMLGADNFTCLLYTSDSAECDVEQNVQHDEDCGCNQHDFEHGALEEICLLYTSSRTAMFPPVRT